MKALVNKEKAEGALQKIRVRTLMKIELYDSEKAQMAGGGKLASALGTHNRQSIDVESLEGGKGNDLLRKNRMDERINHAVDRHKDTLECTPCEKTGHWRNRKPRRVNES